MDYKSKIKSSYDKNRQTLGKIYPLDTPFTVVIDSSEACNFKCEYCFRASDDKAVWGDYAIKKNIMPFEVFKIAVEQIKGFPSEVKSISLSHHGEPLCNRRIPEMVRYIKANGIKSRMSIHTNATILDKTFAGELAESGIDKIVISLQGLDAGTYKRICGADISFESFFDNLKHLYMLKQPETTINIKVIDTVVKNREKEFYELFSTVADAVFIETAVPIWKNIDNKINPGDATNKFGGKFPHQDCCPLLFNTIVVTPDGDVYPCTQLLSKEKLGNIKDKTLSEMWNSPERIELLRRQLMLDPPESCNGCGIKQNTIFSKEDMIDEYRYEILKRLM